MSSKTAAGLVVALAVLAAGCGRDTGNVTGKVSYNGQPVSEGQVIFSDPEYGTHVVAKLQSDGSYAAHCTDGPGLWVGQYTVAVTPPVEEAPLGPAVARPRPKEYPNIPAKFRDPKTSPWKISVEESNPPFDYDLAK